LEDQEPGVVFSAVVFDGGLGCGDDDWAEQYREDDEQQGDGVGAYGEFNSKIGNPVDACGALVDGAHREIELPEHHGAGDEGDEHGAQG